MKTINYIVSVLLLTGTFFACSDDHYDEKETVVNNQDVEVVDMSIIDYLESQAAYSSMSSLFKETGIYDRITAEDLQYTIFVVSNDRATGLPTKADEEEEVDEATFVARAHVSSGYLSPSSLKDGARVLVWNNKYLNVSVTESGQGDIFTFSDSPVKRIIKVANGFVYELESLVSTPRSMLELLESLSDEYSIFKEMVLSKNENVFDKSASVPKGVDASGNTEYDSVFVTTNPYFEYYGADITSESASFTMLIPSNELIENAIAEAKQKLAAWNMERPDSILENWCFQVAFFNKTYYPEDFESNVDLGELSPTNDQYKWTTNIFGRQWRTTENKVDLNNPVVMSNGMAYYITSLKIPQNVLIWRLKNHFKWYTYLSDGDKNTYYNLENIYMQPTGSPAGLRDEVKDWTPGDGWPIVNGMYIWYLIEDMTQDAIFDCKLYDFELHDDGTYDIEARLVPPGEYTLSFGAGKNNITSMADVYFNEDFVTTLLASSYGSFPYDRGGGGYPEFYDPSKLSHDKRANYDRDGGELGVVTITGDEPVNVRLKFRLYNGTGSNFTLFHWCLRPTSNCY